MEAERAQYGPASYGDAFADVYDDWYGELGGVEALVDLVSAGGVRRRVLELGAGTGRLAIPLAVAGHHVVAFDSSAAMLDKLRQTLETRDDGHQELALEMVLGDAAVGADYPSGPFDVVLLAFNLLFNLADRAEQRACLSAAAHRLADDGVVIVECLVPALPAGIEHRRTSREIRPGRTITIETSVDPSTSVIEGAHVDAAEATDGVGVVEIRRRWRLCVASVADVDAIATDAGLRLLSRAADWEGTGFVDDESDRHVSVYGNPL